MDNNTDNNNIEIIISGDYCPVGRIGQLSMEQKYSEIYNDALPYLLDKDLSITNLECPLTSAINPIKKIGPTLSVNPQCINAITYGGFDVVTLSNNHILDQNENGLKETIEVCNKAGIKTVGAGMNLTEASEPLYLKIKSKRISVINITENEFSIASINKAGANPLNLIANYKQISQAKEKSDYILLILHGGNEQYNLPSPEMVQRCHFFTEIGVNAVICHHAHCPSGYEIYNGVPIFYGIGNFLFDKKTPGPDIWNEGFFVKLNINNNSFTIYPYYQNKNRAGLHLIHGEEKEKFLGKIEKLTSIIKDENLLKENWLSFCRSTESYYLKSAFSLNKFQKVLFRNNFFQSLIIKENMILSLYNKISCEAHREVLLDILKSKILKDS